MVNRNPKIEGSGCLTFGSWKGKGDATKRIESLRFLINGEEPYLEGQFNGSTFRPRQEMVDPLKKGVKEKIFPLVGIMSVVSQVYFSRIQVYTFYELSTDRIILGIFKFDGNNNNNKRILVYIYGSRHEMLGESILYFLVLLTCC